MKKNLIWHPFTNKQDQIEIVRAKDSYLFDREGKKYLDLISSWWVNLHGHSNTKIADAISKQSKILEHVIFADFTHKPAIELAKILYKILPPQLERIFFSDNGSCAVEIALKMVYQYWHNTGHKKNLFLSFDGAYHGDTFGAMSVGQNRFHKIFKELCFNTLSIPYPETWMGDQDAELKEQNSLDVLESIISKHPNNICGLIIEPLIQGASGMRMCSPEFVKKVVKYAKDHNILVIFDEVMTGFGRTGTNFALDQTDVPDILCLSKGITGGFLPLAATITNNKIHEAFLSPAHIFAHGHSYTANPLACAAAIESCRILESDKVKKSLIDINKSHKLGISLLRERSSDTIRCPRIRGTVAAFETSKDTSYIKSELMKSGVFLRPLNDTIYMLPPYSTTIEDLKYAYDKISELL